MPESMTFENFQYVYLSSAANTYGTALLDFSTVVANSNYWSQPTGWQYFFNQLMHNWVTQLQWSHLVDVASRIRLKCCSLTVMNMVPLTEQVALQGNTTLTTFNNTQYAVGFTDTKYDTIPVYDPNAPTLLYREGYNYNNNTRMTLLQYNHIFPSRVNNPAGGNALTLSNMVWDPFMHPTDLQELRPGKNAIGYSWERAPQDDDNWMSLIPTAEFKPGNWLSTQNTFQLMRNESTSNQQEQEIVAPSISIGYLQPGNLDWAYTILTPNKGFAGPHAHPSGYSVAQNDYTTAGGLINNCMNVLSGNVMGYHRPIPNFFIKLMPLYTANNALIQTEAQIAVQRSITFEYEGFPSTNTYTRYTGTYQPSDFTRTSYTQHASLPVKQFKAPYFCVYTHPDYMRVAGPLLKAPVDQMN